MKIWYVKFPIYQYNEDVQEIAKQNKFKIIDIAQKESYEAVAGEIELADAPELTIKGAEKKAVKKVVKKKVAKKVIKEDAED